MLIGRPSRQITEASHSHPALAGWPQTRVTKTTVSTVLSRQVNQTVETVAEETMARPPTTQLKQGVKEKGLL
jgi:hypothetical protein